MGMTLHIPDSVIQGLRIPEGEIAQRLRTELAVALYAGPLPRDRKLRRSAFFTERFPQDHLDVGLVGNPLPLRDLFGGLDIG